MTTASAAPGVAVRLFAGAAEAVGHDAVTVEARAGGGTTVGDVMAALRQLGGPLTADVLTRCSFLVAGVRAEGPDTLVPAGAGVDVLPPFAGG